MLAGVVAGATAGAVLLGLGALLELRLWGAPAVMLALVGLLFAAAGLYAGWLAGMMVFSAVRGGDDAAA